MKIDYKKAYDVVVVGGGVAGVAAAVQASRLGKKTALIEKTVFPGGLATSGLIYIYLPLCDGNGKQVTFGLSEELLKLSLKYGPGEIPESWSTQKNNIEEKRYRCIFSPAAFILALDELLINNGVDIWYDSLVCDVVQEENLKVTGVIVENASGRGLVEAKQFVDASGDGAIIRRASGCEVLSNENFQCIWALEYNETSKDIGFGNKVNRFFGGHSPDGGEGASRYDSYNGKCVSQFILEGRTLLRESYDRQYANGTQNRFSNYPLTLAAMPQLRKIFCIKGKRVLKSNENNKKFNDSIGLAADWRKAGPVWEIPYSSMLPEKNIDGIIAAGRCTSAKDDAWEITRVIPTAAMTGQVAGLAASLAIDEKVEIYNLAVSKLQSQLKKYGFKIHIADLGLNYYNK